MLEDQDIEGQPAILRSDQSINQSIDLPPSYAINQSADLPPSYDQSQHNHSVQHENDQPINQPINQSVQSNISPPLAPRSQSINQSVSILSINQARNRSAEGVVRLRPGQPGHLQTTRQWFDGLFECFNRPGICLESCLLPCYRWPATVTKVMRLSIPLGLCYVLSVFALCALLPLIPFAAIVVLFALCFPHYAALFIMSTVGTGATMAAIAAYYRGKIREKYLIEGSFWSDCLIHFWCACCAIAQEARHVDTDYGLIV